MQETATRAQVEAAGPRFDVGRLLSSLDLNAMTDAIVAMSRAEGYRQAAGRIEWFLRDAQARSET